MEEKASQSAIDEVSAYREEIEANRVLSEQEEKEEVEKARKGDKNAIASLVESFAKRAEEMASFRYDGSVPLTDLILEANRGLYYAAGHISNMPLDCSFSSFATAIVSSRLDKFVKEEEEKIEEAEESASFSLQSPNASSSGEAILYSEAAKYPLLSKEQEIELGKKIQKGLSEGASEDEKKEGKEAEDAMVKHNLRLVMSLAKDYASPSLPYLDLCQEGYFGLRTAARKFDPNMGWRFSTYAYPWVKQTLQKLLNEQGRGLKISQYTISRLGKVRKAFDSLSQSLGREPTIAELSAELPEYSPKDIAAILEIPMGVVSLDEPFDSSESDSADLLSTVRGDDDIAESLDEEDRDALIKKGLGCLNDREKTIVSYIYGLSGKEKMDMAALGRRLGISRERVRQIHQSALAKMRRQLQGEEG